MPILLSISGDMCTCTQCFVQPIYGALTALSNEMDTLFTRDIYVTVTFTPMTYLYVHVKSSFKTVEAQLAPK